MKGSCSPEINQLGPTENELKQSTSFENPFMLLTSVVSYQLTLV